MMMMPSIKRAASQIAVLFMGLTLASYWQPCAAKVVHNRLEISQSIIGCRANPTLLINGETKGPTLKATVGDTVIVSVYNALPDQNTTIHFHGIRQRLSPLADGVPYITQDPITPGSTYIYNFTLLPDQAGTYFYHSHVGMQADSVYGAFIVLDDSSLPSPFNYDKELQIVIGERWPQSDSQLYHDVVDTPFKWVGAPTLYTLNEKPYCPNNETDPQVGPNYELEVLEVKPNTTYRLRVIAAVTLEYVAFSIAGHKLTIIEADGTYLEPVEVDHIELMSGQRYSVLLRTDQPPADYAMAVQTLWRVDQSAGSGVFRYEGSTNNADVQGRAAAVPAPRVNETVNWMFDQLHVLLSPPSWPPASLPPPFPKTAERELIFTSSQMALKDGRIRWAVNNVSYEETRGSHGAFPFKLGEVVDIVFQDTVSGNGVCETHPWHTHGHAFWIIGAGNGTYTGNASDVPENPLFRDTTVLYPFSAAYFQPPGVPGDGCGWVKIRFLANNPGDWIVHCHVGVHLAMGMAVVFKVTA